LRYENYTGNNLNQYTQRALPNTFDVIGSAINTSTVSVNDFTTYRKSDYYRAQLTNDNSTAALYVSLTNLAVLNNGTNADIATNIIGQQFVPKTPEIYAHDADGNLTNDGRWMLNWDAENRLVSLESFVSAPSGSRQRLIFSYDHQGRRASKVVSNWTGTVWTNESNLKFAHDAWNLIAKLSSTNTLLQSYHWGKDLSGTPQRAGGVGGLVALTDPTHGTHFAVYDANGNVAGLLKASEGNTSALYEYSGSGKTIRASGAVAKANLFRFGTKFVDDESGFSYYGRRYLNLDNSRWISRDPLTHQTRTTSAKRWLREQGNVYQFAFNDPINHYDVLGLSVNDPRPVSIDVNALTCPKNCGPDYTAAINAELAS
jgi:RHS repeat-associated protein